MTSGPIQEKYCRARPLARHQLERLEETYTKVDFPFLDLVICVAMGFVEVFYVPGLVDAVQGKR